MSIHLAGSQSTDDSQNTVNIFIPNVDSTKYCQGLHQNGSLMQFWQYEKTVQYFHCRIDAIQREINFLNLQRICLFDLKLKVQLELLSSCKESICDFLGKVVPSIAVIGAISRMSSQKWSQIYFLEAPAFAYYVIMT